jgi:hypothetical protein
MKKAHTHSDVIDHSVLEVIASNRRDPRSELRVPNEGVPAKDKVVVRRKLGHCLGGCEVEHIALGFNGLPAISFSTECDRDAEENIPLHLVLRGETIELARSKELILRV